QMRRAPSEPRARATPRRVAVPAAPASRSWWPSWLRWPQHGSSRGVVVEDARYYDGAQGGRNGDAAGGSGARAPGGGGGAAPGGGGGGRGGDGGGGGDGGHGNGGAMAAGTGAATGRTFFG